MSEVAPTSEELPELSAQERAMLELFGLPLDQPAHICITKGDTPMVMIQRLLTPAEVEKLDFIVNLPAKGTLLQ